MNAPKKIKALATAAARNGVAARVRRFVTMSGEAVIVG
jgi:hypothetical protein